MTIRLTRTFIVALLLSIVPAAAPAATITFNFIGVVTAVIDPFGIVGSQVSAGDPVFASLRFDTATVDGYADDPTRGTYLSPGWLTLDINGLAFEQRAGVLIDVLHHGNGDQELFQALVCCGDIGDFGAPTTWPASLPLFPLYAMGFGLGQTT